MRTYIPIMVYIGTSVALNFTSFTTRMGGKWIGHVMTIFGICDAMGSYLAGRQVKRVGRRDVFYMGAVASLLGITLNIAAGICADTATSSCNADPFDSDSVGDSLSCPPLQILLLFLSASFNGIADGVINSQHVALCGILFSERRESAYSLATFLSASSAGLMMLGIAVGVPYIGQICVMCLALGGAMAAITNLESNYPNAFAATVTV